MLYTPNLLVRAFLICYACSYCFIASCAQADTPPTAHNPEILDIPKGFEHMTQDFSGKVLIKLEQRLIGSAPIAFTFKTDTLQLSPQAQTLILSSLSKQLTRQGKKTLTQKLKQPVPANTSKSFKDLNYLPNMIQFYFDEDHLTLKGILPYPLLKPAKKQYAHIRRNPIPDNASLTMANELNLGYESLRTQHHTPWALSGAISYANLNMRYEANNNIQNHFNLLALNHYGSQYHSRLGYQPISGQSSLVSINHLWGLSLQENPHLINQNFYKAYSQPLAIQLSQNYQVKISTAGKTLYSQFLRQGDHWIDTSKFPLGSYQILIEKTNLTTGKTLSETQTFSKNSALYNWMYSGFSLAAGLEKTRFKDATQSPYFSIQNGFNALNGRLDTRYTFHAHEHYLTAEYEKMRSANHNYSLFSTINNHGKFSSGANVSYRLRRHALHVQLARYFYDAINRENRSQYQVNYRYNWAKNSLGFNGSYINHSGARASMTYQKSIELYEHPCRLFWRLQYSQKGDIESTLGLRFFVKTAASKHTFSVQGGSNSGLSSLQWQHQLNYDPITIDGNLFLPMDRSNTNYQLSTSAKNSRAFMQAEGNWSQDSGTLRLNRKAFNAKTLMILGAQGLSFHHKNLGSGILLNLKDLKKKDTLMTSNKHYYPGQTVHFLPQHPFTHTELTLSPMKTSIQLTNPHYETFLYPYNVQTLKINAHQVCLVNFTLHHQDPLTLSPTHQPDIFLFSNEPSTLALIDQQPIQFKILESSQGISYCHTGKTLKCPKESNQALTLGVLNCLP